MNLPGSTEYHEEARTQWGGCHESISIFLFADGSVKAIPVSIPTGALYSSATSTVLQSSILARLGNVDDGNAFTIPGI